MLTPYVDKYLAVADTTWERLGTHKASTALEFIFPRPLASRELLAKVDAWLETSSANPGAISATCARAAPTWPATSPARPRTPRADLWGAGART